MGNFHFAVDCPHLVDGLDFRREPSMDAEDGAVDEGPQWKIVKSLVKVLPGCGATILLDDLIIESIDLGDLPGLVVTPQQDDLLGVF